MNIYEYQAKEILKSYGVHVPDGYLVDNLKDSSFSFLDCEDASSKWAVKAQVYAGGRGKAGGVSVVRGPDRVKDECKRLLGSYLMTEQMGEKGEQVLSVYVERAAFIQKQFYLSFSIERSKKSIIFMISPEGGVNIELVAKERPFNIFYIEIPLAVGFKPFHSYFICDILGLEWETYFVRVSDLCSTLLDIFIKNDLSLLEINPLVCTKDNLLVCLDCKISFDVNAYFRQKKLFDLYVPKVDSKEEKAKRLGFSYISLDKGNVGCMVNGAGLAMATMDIVDFYGGIPCNFLDVGGGSSQEVVQEALRMIVNDDAVKAILINIFGGIMRCDVIALAIVHVLQETKSDKPIVLRLDGTNLEEGQRIIKEHLSSHRCISVNSLDDAARAVVNLLEE